MSFFGKIVDFISGGVGSKIVDTVAAHFPPDMSEQEKEQMKLVIAKASREYELELLRVVQKEQESFNQRIKDLEGTAADLNQAGWLGRIILFLRGLQRPIWGFAVLYLDFMVFSGAWPVSQKAAGSDSGAAKEGANNVITSFTATDLESAFWVINFLVLGFLFGERAVRNVMPFFQARFGGGAAPASPQTNNRAVG
ncbi:MAG: hypothetical protein ACR2PT_12315 [Endozoicomonas sp.]